MNSKILHEKYFFNNMVLQNNNSKIKNLYTVCDKNKRKIYFFRMCSPIRIKNVISVYEQGKKIIDFMAKYIFLFNNHSL